MKPVNFKKTITINYKAGHSYEETWELSGELFCPHCGKRDVWVEQSGGDYYVGQQHLCSECRWTFYLPTIAEANDENDQQRLAKLSGN